jgi:molecular chaperone HtpG
MGANDLNSPRSAAIWWGVATSDDTPITFQEKTPVTATDAAPKPATHAFQADVARLLHLMVHSVYSDRDIFLRELISNAADACEKLRYEALAEPALVAGDAAFVIRVEIDKDKGTLSVVDNGVGMSRDELVSALGTIANSGTRAFLERIAAERKDEARAGAELIGQFGIGFYSAFMVADEVVVDTRRAGEAQAWRWRSDGKGEYEIAALDSAEAPARGARVTLHLMESAKDLLESGRVERILREHSGGVAVPVEIVEAGGPARRVADGAALWARPKSEISQEDYTEFYRDLTGQWDEPALTIHWHAEGRHDYRVLAFVPGSRPLDLFTPERKGHAKLYVRRVLITHEADVLPGWLRFVRLVVDSADLPLNVSREMIQESPVFAAIRKGVVNRIVQELGKLAESEPEKFARIWENFGAVLKEGLYEDPERRDGLFKIARFATTTHRDGGRSLADYVGALRPNQTAIYYLAGEDAGRLAASPQLEGFRARGLEVLLLSDPVDAFWVSTAAGYDGKPFKSVTQGGADIKSIPLAEGADDKPAETSAAVAALFARMKQVLEGAVSEVRASDRLSESPACLVAADHALDRRLEKMLAESGRADALTRPVLELNPGHPLITALAARIDEGDDALVDDLIWLVHDEARVVDGEKPSDPAAFAARLTRVLARVAGAPA